MTRLRTLLALYSLATSVAGVALWVRSFAGFAIREAGHEPGSAWWEEEIGSAS